MSADGDDDDKSWVGLARVGVVPECVDCVARGIAREASTATTRGLNGMECTAAGLALCSRCSRAARV
jgi:hypothetical protein